MRGPARAAALLAALATLAATGRAAAEDVVLRAGDQEVRIGEVGGLPVEWTGCAGPCADPGVARQRFAGQEDGDGALRWVADDADGARATAAVTYAAELSETPELVIAVLTARDTVDGQPLVQRYELSRTTHTLRARLAAPPGVGLGVASGAGFIPPALPGFGAASGDVEVVRVDRDGQEAIEPAAHEVGEVSVARDSWFGVRQRFWAWLARPAADTPVLVESAADNRPVVTWRAPAGRLDLEFYAGPVEWKSLRVVSPDLAGMLFHALWEPLRQLCFALLYLLGLIGGVVGNPGLAIILLSLVVKILLWPLTRVADGWQQDVNRAQSRLQPKLAAIRRQYRGEDAHNRTLQAYRDEGVHPLFTLKSLAGFAIQVPMFIAAFDMLADNFALSGASFLWIGDLAAPDRFLPLPVALPFFGADLNLLPVLMTALTVLSALTQRDDSLTPELLHRQRRQLYLMAGGFFLLFYTFPAGMVLYWTANNFWHLVKLRVTALVARRR